MSVSSCNPVVLAIGGHDPSGGAGLQADIESIIANGGRAVSLVTALTTQNTFMFNDLQPTDPVVFKRQANCLLDDITPAAVKIGLLPNAELALAVSGLLKRLPACPVVLDPVLSAGVGPSVCAAETLPVLRDLMSQVAVITPNTDEARLLGESDRLDTAIDSLLARDCPNVLLTGTHAPGTAVCNTLFSRTARMTWEWPRLPDTFHGSGCTLAASLATFLVFGMDVVGAATLAQEFTWQSLAHGLQLGRGQMHPCRQSRRP